MVDLFLKEPIYKHFSDEELGEIYDVPQQDHPGTSRKPRGLWLGIGDSWNESGIRDNRVAYEYEVRLNLQSKVLFLDGGNKDTVLEFVQKYGRHYDEDSGKWVDEFDEKQKVEWAQRDRWKKDQSSAIDWKKVSQDYDGISITSPWETHKAGIPSNLYYDFKA
jgi:hypothetical protein